MSKRNTGVSWWTVGLALVFGFVGGAMGFLVLARFSPLAPPPETSRTAGVPGLSSPPQPTSPDDRAEGNPVDHPGGKVPASLNPAPQPRRDPESRNEIVRAAKRVNPAVVRVDTYQAPDPRLADLPGFQMPFPAEGSGSGFIFDESGLILTNQHVIDGAQAVGVVLEDGREFQDVEVKGEDFMSDIAVLHIQDQHLPPAPLGTAEGLEPGEWVIAIGNPFRDFEHSVTVGIVSAIGRDTQIRDEMRGRERYYTNLIQTDAAINVGNSGGPLINIKGQVIGINSAIFSPTQTSLGIGFAIPIDDAKIIARHLIETGQVPYIGIRMGDLSREQEQKLGLSGGVMLMGIEPSGPAALAGLQPGDILLRIGERQVTTSDELPQTLFQHRVGEVVMFRVMRNGREQNMAVRIGARN